MPSAIIRRVYYTVTNSPFRYNETKYFLFGYSISILGAFLMTKNPLFAYGKMIEKVLMDKRMQVDKDTPWKVVVTPEYLFFEVYNCDFNQFINDKSFWSSINFTPGEYIPFKDKTNRFIVPKKYELDPKIEFKFDFKKEFPENKENTPEIR
jgi:hypothetical protein